MNERELEQEAQEHYQAMIDQGMSNALAATLAWPRAAEIAIKHAIDTAR